VVVFSSPVQAIIRESQNVVVEMEVRPHFLVPDTNCFVDYLHQIKLLAQASSYALRVPLVGELAVFSDELIDLCLVFYLVNFKSFR